ncbi:hypothetical protein [Microbacterium sp. NPDC089695]|uniref:hypothetical protein n=1 Tax=Microbacterium sp. NPDC089695 TaxID=3364198 RepID=UPI003809E987
MDRRLVVQAQLAIPNGHRIDVTEHLDDATGEASVLSIVDLDTGVRYRRIDELRGEILRWVGRVVECTVTIGAPVARTTLLVATDDESAGRGAEARTALHGADAAVDAAKAEADRWGGGDRLPEPEPERFW